MTLLTNSRSVLLLLTMLAASPSIGQELTVRGPQTTLSDSDEYRLGPGDQLKLWVLGLEEISDRPLRVDGTGFIDVPLVGRVKAGGLTVEGLREALVENLQKEVRVPKVTIDVVEYSSHPVSVLGAVNQPGLQFLRDRKTLVEALSSAGGIRADAGCCVNLTRSAVRGSIPLAWAHPDASGKFSVAELKLSDILDTKLPTANILVEPDDVISVPVAQMVYVMGAVHKSGGFTLHQQEHISTLQALAMAEGLESTSSPRRAEILRPVAGSGERQRIPVDVKTVMAGKGEDLQLRANDILFVPDNTQKKVAIKALEVAIAVGTGVVIFRR